MGRAPPGRRTPMEPGGVGGTTGPPLSAVAAAAAAAGGSGLGCNP